MAFDDLFGPTPLSIKRKAFDEDLLKIEDRYIDYFKSRPPLFDWDEHDFLHNHYVVMSDNYKISFAFNGDSELPEYIKRECYLVFQNHFSTDSDVK